MSIKWDQAYAPQMAANGSFAPIDMSTIAGYPATFTNGEGTSGIPSLGRYAVLTYVVGSDVSSPVLSGGLPNTTIEEMITLTAPGSAVWQFNNQPVVLMEISNRSGGSVYLTYSNTTDFATLTSEGMEIANGSFYSIDRTTTKITLGSNLGGNVVVFGHYKA